MNKMYFKQATFLLGLSFLLVCLPGPARTQTVIPVGKKELKQYVQQLASPEFEGRGTGEEGGRKAALYLREKFQEIGLQPLKNGDFLNEFSVYIARREQCYVQCDEYLYKDFEEMFCGTLRFSQNEETEKEVIFGGDGDTLALKEMQIEGKIVAILATHLRTTYRLTEFLSEKGAYAVFYAHPDDDRQFESMCRTLQENLLKKSYSFDQEEKAIKLDKKGISFVPAPDKIIGEFYFRGRELAKMFGKSLRELRKMKSLREIPSGQVRLLCRRKRELVKIANVTGIVKGKAGSTRTLVVTAHYDHLGKQKGVLYPGADDNASGVAAMLGVAASMVAGRYPLECDLVFAAVTGEECGFWGSRYFLDSTAAGLDIIADINIDMMGRIDDELSAAGKQLHLYGDVAHPLFSGILSDLGRQCPLLLHLEQPTGFSSDHEVFRARGIPALFLYSGSHEDLHQPTDVWQRLDYKRLELRTRFAAALIQRLSK